MSVSIHEIRSEDLHRYGDIPIAFEVTSILRLDLVKNGLGGVALGEESAAGPYVKDYDARQDGGPERWPNQFDTRNWGFFIAAKDDHDVGGVAIAHDTPGVHMLEGRRDLAVVWDIRVRPEARGRGIGTALFRHAVDWSRRRGCRQLKVETQNVNVPACRFYVRQGCRLGIVNRYAYVNSPDVSDEVMLVWYLDL